MDWLRAGRTVKRSDKFKITSDGRTHKLIVKDVDSRDMAEYTAQYKTKTTSAKLNVECE